MYKIKALKLTNSRDKALGKIKYRKENIFFQTRFGIHTFGIKEPIDIFVLDNKLNVVKIKKELKPQRFFFWNIKYNNILEINSDIKENLKIGDTIHLIPTD